jgi:hypothetical protein
MEPFGVSRNVRVGDRVSGPFQKLQSTRRQEASAAFCDRKACQINMLVNPREVASVLALVLVLLVAKHLPFLAFLPLAHITGVVCFSFAIYLALKIYNAELARIRSE